MRKNEILAALEAQVRTEPEPPLESIFEHVRAPFPSVHETPVVANVTNITYGGAIRAALDNIIRNHGGVMWGQDVANWAV